MDQIKKQYLIVVDDLTMACLARICPTMMFIEAVGMDIADNKEYRFLVSPIAKPSEEPVTDVSDTPVEEKTV